jgi:hypothetical protein
MAEVLCVYRQVQVLKKAAKSKKPRKPVAIVSCDGKPGIQAIATTAPDLPPQPGVHPTFARDHEYKRHGTLSLLAGIDLLTGKVHALVRDRHRSREFIEFLKLLDAAYPTHTAIKLILDNHSAHISRETRAWLAFGPAPHPGSEAHHGWYSQEPCLGVKVNSKRPSGRVAGELGEEATPQSALAHTRSQRHRAG